MSSVPNTATSGTLITGAPATGQTLSEEDYELIVKACNMIKDTATDMETIGRKINSAGEYCSPTDFYVDGYSYSDNVSECSNCFQFASKGLDEYADSILLAVNKAFKNGEDPSSGNNPPEDGGGQNPPEDGGQTPPEDGGQNPPEDGGGQNPPEGGGQTPPEDGGGQNPPGPPGEGPPGEGPPGQGPPR